MSGTQNFAYQKWPDKIFPTGNCDFPTVVTLVWTGGRGGPGGVTPPNLVLRCTAIPVLPYPLPWRWRSRHRFSGCGSPMYGWSLRAVLSANKKPTSSGVCALPSPHNPCQLSVPMAAGGGLPKPHGLRVPGWLQKHPRFSGSQSKGLQHGYMDPAAEECRAVGNKTDPINPVLWPKSGKKSIGCTTLATLGSSKVVRNQIGLCRVGIPQAGGCQMATYPTTH